MADASARDLAHAIAARELTALQACDAAMARSNPAMRRSTRSSRVTSSVPGRRRALPMRRPAALARCADDGQGVVRHRRLPTTWGFEHARTSSASEWLEGRRA